MFGSHLSIAGGMHNAVAEATRLSFDTVQVFTKNQQQWAVKPLESDAIDAWRTACKSAGFTQTVSHDSYLINLATQDPALRAKSVALFEEELRRCEALGIPYLVTHPGAHLCERDDEAHETAGLVRVAQALTELLAKFPKGTTTVCVESTAGQGTCLGHKLEHLGLLIKLVKPSKRIGVCLDTAHLFAAGYDFRGRKYSAFLKQLDETVGPDGVKVWHLNDSKKPLGSRVDRHHHIGHGEIGLDGFRPIVRDKRWADVPKILETAKDKDERGRDWDVVNLETLRGLMK
ncbi:MAG: deoxyribonuclease IV [Tepidisphaeraceae bacterium]